MASQSVYLNICYFIILLGIFFSESHPSMFQVPLNFLGDTEAGKSSLLASLMNNMKPVRVPPEKRTVGAKVGKVLLKDEEVELHILDYAGHMCYTQFNQAYLNPFAINVIFVKVCSPFGNLECGDEMKKWLRLVKKECRGQVRKWLRLVLAKIPDAMFLLVLSKCDLLSEEEEQGVVDLLTKEFNDVLQRPTCSPQIVCISCHEEKAKGFREFLDSCMNMMKSKSLCDRFFKLSEFPSSWEKFLGSLEDARMPGCLSLSMNSVRAKAEMADLTAAEEVDACLFLFQIMGRVIHYRRSHYDMDQLIFHDPDQLLELLGQIVHHDQVDLLKVFISKHMTDTNEGNSVLRSFEDQGRIPLSFLKSRIPTVSYSFKHNLSDAVIDLAQRIGLCIVVGKEVFIPSLVQRHRSEVEDDLKKLWLADCSTEYQFNLKLHWPSIPIGLFERLVVEVASYSTGMINWSNGCFCNGWECLVLFEEESKQMDDHFSQLVFKIRVEAEAKEDACIDMTWLFWACQRALSFFQGVKADCVAPCRGSRCRGYSFHVQKFLGQSYSELNAVKCPECPKRHARSAADVFPVEPQGKPLLHLHV